MVELLVSLSLAWSCMVCLCLMFVIDVNWVFCCGLVFGLRPLWSPSWVLIVVLSGRHFPHIQAKFEATWSPLKWVKSPSGLGKSPFGCVCGLFSLFYSISLLFSSNPNPSFFSINKPPLLHFSSSSMLSLLHLLGFGFLRARVSLAGLRWIVWLVCWLELGLCYQVWISSFQVWPFHSFLV